MKEDFYNNIYRKFHYNLRMAHFWCLWPKPFTIKGLQISCYNKFQLRKQDPLTCLSTGFDTQVTFTAYGCFVLNSVTCLPFSSCKCPPRHAKCCYPKIIEVQRCSTKRQYVMALLCK